MCENMRNMFKLNQSLTWQKAKAAQLEVKSERFFHFSVFFYPEKTARHFDMRQRFTREMASEERAQKFHIDDVSLTWSG